MTDPKPLTTEELLTINNNYTYGIYPKESEVEKIFVTINFLRAQVEALREMREALEAAEIALADLGACPDPDCADTACVRALPKVRAVLAKLTEGA